MKLKNLQIENYRSIENLSIDFHEQLNVFVGANGAGKSTILDAVATSLSHLIRRIENPNRTGFQISLEDIRNGSDFSSIACSIEEEKTLYKWKVAKANKGSKMIRTRYPQLNQLVDHFQKELKEKKQLPVVCSYPISREVEKINPKIDNNGVGDIFKTYENALDGRRDYKRFFEWFRNQEDIVNQETSSQDYLYKKNNMWMFDDMTEIFNINEEILRLNNSEDSIPDRIIRTKESYRNDMNPEYMFLELRILISHVARTFELGYNSVLLDLENVFYSMEVLNRKFLTPDIDRYLGDIFSFIQNAIAKLIEITYDTKMYDLQWNLLELTLNLVFWQYEEEDRAVIRELIGKVKREEERKEDLFKQIAILFYNKKEKRKLVKQDFPELKTIKQTLESFLPDYTNMRVERKGNPKMLIDKNGQTFSMEQLSDGEKNLIALVGDIARRFAIAYPNSTNPLHENGIILIDEVDLHLHPAWQRLVIPKLVETFPNSQFFISTHSPQVISHVKHDCLYLLRNKNNKLNLLEFTGPYGRTSDWILEDIFDVDTRPKEIVEELKQLFELIARKKILSAREKVDILKKQIPFDKEILRAERLIRMEESKA